jgi:hypothetical protein
MKLSHLPFSQGDRVTFSPALAFFDATVRARLAPVAF